MPIKRTNNASIRAFAERVQKDAAQFDGTDYEVKSKDLTRRWRKWIGSDFQSINKMVDETGIITYGWSKKFPLHQLVDKEESHLCARRAKDADEKMKDDKKQDRRKNHQIENYKYLDLQGDVRKKRPPDGPPNTPG